MCVTLWVCLKIVSLPSSSSLRVQFSPPYFLMDREWQTSAFSPEKTGHEFVGPVTVVPARGSRCAVPCRPYPTSQCASLWAPLPKEWPSQAIPGHAKQWQEKRLIVQNMGNHVTSTCLMVISCARTFTHKLPLDGNIINNNMICLCIPHNKPFRWQSKTMVSGYSRTITTPCNLNGRGEVRWTFDQGLSLSTVSTS